MDELQSALHMFLNEVMEHGSGVYDDLMIKWQPGTRPDSGGVFYVGELKKRYSGFSPSATIWISRLSKPRLLITGTLRDNVCWNNDRDFKHELDLSDPDSLPQLAEWLCDHFYLKDSEKWKK